MFQILQPHTCRIFTSLKKALQMIAEIRCTNCDPIILRIYDQQGIDFSEIRITEETFRLLSKSRA